MNDLTLGGERVASLSVTTRLVVFPSTEGVRAAPNSAVVNPIERANSVPVTGIRNMNERANTIT